MAFTLFGEALETLQWLDRSQKKRVFDEYVTWRLHK